MEKKIEYKQENSSDPIEKVIRFWELAAALLLAVCAWCPIRRFGFDTAQCFCLLAMLVAVVQYLLIIIGSVCQSRNRQAAAESCRNIAEFRMQTVIKVIVYTFACIFYLIYCICEKQAIVQNSIYHALAGALLFAGAAISSEYILAKFSLC